MLDFGGRLKQRRDELELTQDEVAAGVKKLVPELSFNRVTLSNIENGTQKSVKDRILLALVKVLKCSPDWLVYGEGDKELATFGNNVSTGPKVEQKCPLISWVQAGVFTSIQEFPEQDYSYYPCPTRCGPRTYILEVRGDSMSPRFEEGDLIYVDPDQVEADHGKFVIAQLEDSPEATFKQLQVMDGRKLLKALNPDYPPELKYIQINGNCRLVGTVIAHVRPI
ncbi:helix-turn-helix domain-containing protein [Salinivibrio proteolyticus]|uniref:Helix-turn-helix domain-containing protein n=1 Tax=Salinivibrio proteolyticus TaxID=334715 RepID=A0ABY7L9E9_9GAMM|nr:S24 family peptidase [Salinivibrio proteolyticus]WBA13879.1 helix-turn-helix domain-containing protein [Salinivibrio proteolyticus]